MKIKIKNEDKDEDKDEDENKFNFQETPIQKDYKDMDIEEKKNEINNLKEEIINLKKNLEETQKIKNNQQEIENLNEEIKNLNEKIEKLITKNTNSAINYNIIKNQKSKLEEQIIELEEKIIKLEEQIIELNKNLLIKNDNYDNLKRKLTIEITNKIYYETEKKLKEKENIYDTILEKYETEKEKHIKKMEELEKKYKDELVEIDKKQEILYREKNKKLENDYKNLQNQLINQHQTEMNKMKDEFHEKINKIQNDNITLLNENRGLIQTKNLLNKKIDNYDKNMIKADIYLSYLFYCHENDNNVEINNLKNWFKHFSGFSNNMILSDDDIIKIINYQLKLLYDSLKRLNENKGINENDDNNEFNKTIEKLSFIPDYILRASLDLSYNNGSTNFYQNKFEQLILNIINSFYKQNNESQTQGGNFKLDNEIKQTIKKNIPKIINMLFYGLIIIIVLLLILYLYNKYKVITYKFHRVKDFEDKQNSLKLISI